ncbi:MAG: phytanoyl-CoA dioxygenase family protein, partial [Pyrinomonadaceae bacterium]
MAHLSCWIGLDDSTRENGCVHYVPGSHRWDVLPREDFANDMDMIKGVLTEAQMREFKPVAIELTKGECSFHHPLMVHGSFENQTDRPRRAVVINVMRDGVRSASDEPLLQGVPPIPRNTKIEGQFSPLLFDPQSVFDRKA